jgi:hypothetical protein
VGQAGQVVPGGPQPAQADPNVAAKTAAVERGAGGQVAAKESDIKQTTVAPDGTKTTIQSPPGTAPGGELPPPPTGQNPNIAPGAVFGGGTDPMTDAGRASQLSPEAAQAEQERKANDPRYQAASSGVSGMVQGHEDKVMEAAMKTIDDERLRNDPATRVEVHRQMKEFGKYPGQDDPDAPAPTIRPNKPNFNPYTGKWTKGKGPSYKKMLARPGDKTMEDHVQDYYTRKGIDRAR